MSVRTSAGKFPIDGATGLAWARLPDGSRKIIISAAHLRRLESVHGRLELDIVGADGELVAVVMSRQGTNAATAGTSEFERRYGSSAAAVMPHLLAAGVSEKVATKLLEAASSCGNVRQGHLAALSAATLASGGRNRWCRQLASTLRAGDFAVIDDLRSLCVGGSTYGGWAAGVTPRDLVSAREAARIVRAATTPAEFFTDTVDDTVLAAAVAEHRARFGGSQPWVHSTFGNVSSSGFKLHVFCDSAADVEDAYSRLLPTLIGRNLRHKTATASFADSGTAQSRKGIVVYLHHRDTAPADVSALKSALGTWQRTVPPGGDIDLGDGVGLRFEFAIDPGCDVGPAAYSALYMPPVDTIAPDRRIQVEEVLDEVRRSCDDRQLDVELFATHLSDQRSDFAGLAASNPDLVYRALDLTEAGVPAALDDVPLALPQEVFDAYLEHPTENRLLGAYQTVLGEGERARFEFALAAAGDVGRLAVRCRFAYQWATVTVDVGWAKCSMVDPVRAELFDGLGWSPDAWLELVEPAIEGWGRQTGRDMWVAALDVVTSRRTTPDMWPDVLSSNPSALWATIEGNPAP